MRLPKMCPGDTDFCPHGGCTTCQGDIYYFKDPDNGAGRIDEGDADGWWRLLESTRDYPWFPANEDYEKHYVRDCEGTIWLLVHDDGMVTTADYSGKIWSAGIQWLENTKGPLDRL